MYVLLNSDDKGRPYSARDKGGKGLPWNITMYALINSDDMGHVLIQFIEQNFKVQTHFYLNL